MPAPAKATSSRPVVATAPKPKILRIGIIQGGRIVEERLVRKRESVSIGQSSKNMFVVPSESLPREWLLFELVGGKYVGNFAEGMDGKIAVGNDIISIAQLKAGKRLQRRGSAHSLVMDERGRGKITVADITILFQFVTPPPPQPRPQLPASVRGSMFSGMDWLFTIVAAGSFLLHLGGVLYLRSVDWPRKPDIEAIPDRFVSMVQTVKPKEEKKPKVDDKAGKEDKKVEKKKPAGDQSATANKAPKKEMSAEEKAAAAEAKARADAERRARLADQVKNTGLLKLLGARSGDGAGSLNDVLGRGDVDRNVEEAMKGVGGVGVAGSADGLKGIRGGGSGSGKVASVGGLRGGGGIAAGGTGEGVAEKKVSGVVKSEAPAVDGELDPGLVAKEVRTRIGAVKGCYERALKRNPSLSGKIVVRWTITQAGTVTGVDIDNDSMGDSEVVSCIKSLISHWRFPSPSGGSVEVSYPFVFSAAQ